MSNWCASGMGTWEWIKAVSIPLAFWLAFWFGVYKLGQWWLS